MTHGRSRIRSLIAAALFLAVVAAPALARAAESLTWARVYAGPDNIPNSPSDPIPVAGAFNGVSFADGSNGWAVGVRVDNANQIPTPRIGFFAYTSDGGSTWASGTVGVSYELQAVHALSSTDVWAVGRGGTIVHWNGLSWSTRTVPGWPTTKAFYGVSFADPLHGWAVGDGRGVVYTSDGGGTWSIIATPGSTGVLNAVAANSASTALAVGDAGQIKALSATSMSDRATIGSNLCSVAFADNNNVWAVGSDAGVFKSSNGGLTWASTGFTRVMPGGFSASDLTIRSVSFGNPYDGVIVSTYQMVWRTTDAGATWTPERLTDLSTLGDYELTGIAFAGSAATPVAVGRAFQGALDSSDAKTRIYRGAWSGLGPQPPLAPSGVTVADGGAPAPSILVSWADNSADEDGFNVQRSEGSAAGPFTTVAAVGSGVTSFKHVLSAGDLSKTYYYRVQSHRDALASFWALSGPFYVADPANPDTTAPVTTSNAQATYLLSATITLSAVDNAGGSGVATTFYTINGGPPVESSTVHVSGAGAYTLQFWSRDAALNLEAPKTASFKITLPAAKLTVPVAPARVRRSRLFTVTGYITKHPAGTRVVKLYCYKRLSSGKYSWRKTVTVAVANHTTAMSKYAARLSLPTTGRWRIRAGHADAGHKQSFSGYEYLTVY